MKMVIFVILGIMYWMEAVYTLWMSSLTIQGFTSVWQLMHMAW